MYVCLCNGITCRDVRQAYAEGARTPAQVFKAHDTRPQCGKCLPCMREVLADAAAEAKSATSAPVLSGLMPGAAFAR